MHSQDANFQKIAIALASLAGFIDAIGYLSLSGVFVSFMSGNSTRFAVGLSSGQNVAQALIPLAIIFVFVGGVIVGRIIRHFATHKPSTILLNFMSFILISAAILYALGFANLAALLLAFAMGSANNIFFRGGEVSVGVTYMTGTLVKFGQRLAARLLGEKDSNWLPYFLLWSGLVSGAVVGSLGYIALGFNILWAGIAFNVAIAVISSRIEVEAINR